MTRPDLTLADHARLANLRAAIATQKLDAAGRAARFAENCEMSSPHYYLGERAAALFAEVMGRADARDDAAFEAALDDHGLPRGLWVAAVEAWLLVGALCGRVVPTAVAVERDADGDAQLVLVWRSPHGALHLVVRDAGDGPDLAWRVLRGGEPEGLHAGLDAAFRRAYGRVGGEIMDAEEARDEE